jgi:hypothetical protein
MPPNTRTTAHQATAWDRAAITILGGAGCALSYDALQQMAIAIHVRPALTYLFPAVIDGFIAYGIRALLVLHTAPFRARLYIWTLFTTATAASIWANALHAIRLNQQTHTTGLHLDDTTVGILSTLAPLALAGAVHLHILITRHEPPPAPAPAAALAPAPAPAPAPRRRRPPRTGPPPPTTTPADAGPAGDRRDRRDLGHGPLATADARQMIMPRAAPGCRARRDHLPSGLPNERVGPGAAVMITRPSNPGSAR